MCVSKVQNSTQNLRGGGGGGSYHPVRPTVDEVNNKRPAGGARFFFVVIKGPLNVCLNMFQDKTEEDDPSQVTFAKVQVFSNCLGM